jgi:hypothetical protein
MYGQTSILLLALLRRHRLTSGDVAVHASDSFVKDLTLCCLCLGKGDDCTSKMLCEVVENRRRESTE